MKCPRCPGHWKIKEISGHPRKICDECGYLDSRESFINDIYHGPPMKTPLKFDMLVNDENGNTIYSTTIDTTEEKRYTFLNRLDELIEEVRT